MGWKIIEIENGSKINLFLDNIVIYFEVNKVTIPLKDIDVLLINNYKIIVSVQLLNALSSENVLVIFCDNNYLPCSLLIPVIGNYNTLKVLESQINWNHKFKSKTWKNIIENKIMNQALFVKHILNNNDKYDEILSFKESVKDYDVSNREGHASKVYWHTVFGNDFKRFDDDYTNKLLNYGYTILRAYVTRSIVKKGLDPRISLFHKSFNNYFALSSDLMEVFRTIIDIEVYSIVINNIINFYDAKQILIESFNRKILVNNVSHFINNAIDKYIDAIVNQSELPEILINYESL